MILLIVDDESHTRNGLMTSVDWKALGIDTVIQAPDGRAGLRAAVFQKPDIVLSDVRMPVMNGIDMMNRIRETLPDTVFVFMSGFSDKEYLKAAIRIGAVSYVEKPIDFREITEAVREAAARCLQIKKQNEAQLVNETVLSRRLARNLTIPHAKIDHTEDLCRSLRTYCSAITFLLQTDPRTERGADFLTETETVFQPVFNRFHIRQICAEKHPFLYVFHLFHRDMITERMIRNLSESMVPCLPQDSPCRMAFGQAVPSYKRLYESYSDAAALLQYTFFFPSKRVLYVEKKGIVSVPGGIVKNGRMRPVTEYEDRFRLAVSNGDEEQAAEVLASLYDFCNQRHSVLVNEVQALYNRFFSVLAEAGRQRQMVLQDTSDECFLFDELHQSLCAQTDGFFRIRVSAAQENAIVSMIQQYIRSHYSDPLLSTKEISDHICRSVSYTCTIFKNEKGQTLNQFLTEYRIDRAKELLRDPRNNISEVAASVGYNDSNYFSKVFRKSTGCSPSEYRERKHA
ncbi:MAG: response regulator [Butyrivibrio sp.]|nr:response regulator [Butyrivibrio sp.]